MENQFDVVRARFAALSKEKDNLGKVVLDLRAVIADQDILLISAKKKGHELKVTDYPIYEEELIKFQSMVKAGKARTEMLLANRTKVEKTVEMERHRREAERSEEESAVIEYTKVLRHHIEEMMATYEALMGNKGQFESTPEDLLAKVAKHLDRTESWGEIVSVFHKLQGIGESWEETAKSKDEVDIHCMKVYGLYYEMVSKMEAHYSKLKMHEKGDVGMIATPSEGIVEFKTALDFAKDVIERIVENDDFPGVDLRGCVGKDDYLMVLKKWGGQREVEGWTIDTEGGHNGLEEAPQDEGGMKEEDNPFMDIDEKENNHGGSN